MLQENLRRLFCAVILRVANEGSEDIYREALAQTIAGGIISSGPCDSGETIRPIADLLDRVAELTDMQGRSDLWDELVPGPVRHDQDWDSLVALVEAFADGRYDAHLDGIEDGAVQRPKNIVLNYPVRIVRKYHTTLSADRCEFFEDEHCIQWAKFVATNGEFAGKEHMIRTDMHGFTVVKV